MAETDKQILDAIKNMEHTIKDQNRLDMFPRTNDERSLDALSKKIEDLQKGNLANTKKTIDAYNESMKKNNVDKEIKDLKDVLASKDEEKALKSIAQSISQIPKLNESGFSYDEQIQMFAKLDAQAESAGTTLEKLGIKVTSNYNSVEKKQQFIIKENGKATDKLNTKIRKLSKANAEAEETTRKFEKELDVVSGLMSKLGGAAKKIGGDFIKLAEQEQRFAQQNATADAGWIDGLLKMQITTLDYMKILKETRIESLAMSGAGRDFKDTLIEGQKSLVGFTKDSTEAANVSKDFIKNTSRMGVAQKDLEGAVTEQTDIYKEHYRVLGYSAEEFAKLTDELVNDQGMRSQLLNLQEKERRQYVLGIQQRMAEYQTMGYTIERAKELQKTFQSLNAMNPKERMKQAAKTRAMMGALGMGAQGEELFKLQTQYRTMSADEKVVADKRMTEIQSQASAKFGEQSGSGASMGQAMSFQMMADKTGFTTIANTFETASGEGLKLTREQLDTAKAAAVKQNEISETAKVALQVQDTWRAAQGTALSSIGTNILSGFGELASINTAGFISTALATKTAGGLGGGGAAGKIGKMGKFLGAGAALYAAWETGSFIGDKIAEGLQATDMYGPIESVVGGVMDGINWLQAQTGNEDAIKQIENNEAVEMMKAQMAQARQIADEQAARADKGNELTKEGTSAANNQATKQQTANQIAKHNPARSVGL